MASLRLTTHADLVHDQLNHPPLGSRRLPGGNSPVRAGTSGSGDGLLVLAWSAADLARERAAGVRLFSRLGIKSGMRVANALPGALATPGSLLLGDVVQDLDALDIPVGVVGSEAAAKQAWTLIDLVQPEILVLDAVSGEPLFANAAKAERPWCKGIIWLRTDSDQPPFPSPTPETGFAGWQRIWLAVPEVTSFVAVTCSSGRYHPDDEVQAEVVDERIALIPSGFQNEPLRYLSGFRGALPAAPCPCGVAGATITLDDE